MIQATALAPTALEAETIAKAALLLGPDRGRALLARGGGALILDDGELVLAGDLNRRRPRTRAYAMTAVPTQQVFWLASRAFGIVAIIMLAISVGLGLAMSGRIIRRPGLPAKLKRSTRPPRWSRSG